MTRSYGPARIEISSGADANIARKALGEAELRAELGGTDSATVRHTFSDGRVVEAEVRGDQKRSRVHRPKGDEGNPPGEPYDQLRLYVTSTSGLLIFDLKKKRLAKTVSGLSAYEVDEVTRSGKIVYMTGATIPVRVDLGNNTAFGYVYPINAVNISDVIVPACHAAAIGQQLSPKEDKVLVAFDQAYNGSSVVIDALGGYVYADAETLVPLRNAFRMSFRPQVSCFGNDGRFYMSVSRDTDPGDAPNYIVATSDKDYVAQFDSDGTLLATRLIYTWPFSPDSGFRRTIESMVASFDNKRLYVLSQQAYNVSNTTLWVINIENPAMPIVTSIAIAGGARDMMINRAGNRLALLHASTSEVTEIDIVGDVLTIASRTTDANFNTGVAYGVDNWGSHGLRPAPPAVFEVQDRKRYIFKNITAGGSVFGYNQFSNASVYDYDLDGHNVGNRYALNLEGETSQ